MIPKMMVTQNRVDKGSPVSLPQQLRQILQHRIETAYYAPGRKIDSVRKISAEFNVSMLTVQRALKQLESDGFVVSVPASGIFVNQEFAREKKTARIAFVFPEAEISPEILSPENWALSAEIYRGLLSGARKYGAQVDFIHAEPENNLLSMLRQVKRLSRYNALVFVGEQLLELQQKMAQEMPVFHIPASNKPVSDVIDITYDRDQAVRDLAAHAAACGSRTVSTISYVDVEEAATSAKHWNFYDKRATLFLTECLRLGLKTAEGFQIHHDDPGGLAAVLRRILTDSRFDFIFYNHTNSIPVLYEVCAELGIRIGYDLKVAAIASGLTFHGLIPSLTHIRVPMFELAMETVSATCRRMSGGFPLQELQGKMLRASLVVGKSTMPEGMMPPSRIRDSENDETVPSKNKQE